jgi:hypothetical protein
MGKEEAGQGVGSDRTYRSAARPRYKRPRVNPRRPSLRSTIDALAQALADAVLLAVRRTPLTELAGALDSAAADRAIARTAAPEAARASRRADVPPPAPSARSPRARRAPPAAARRDRPLALSLDPPNAYPEVAIVDPDAVLGRQASKNGPGAPIVAADDAESLPASPPALAPVSEPPAPPAAARPTTRLRPGPGEELLRATGGGVVLRRRRPAPNPAP